ncbi:hypothetical protein N9850_13955 [Granulosicoccus sp.]|nr:hypothetical protein [Granulosicoccus sp.]MDB4224867.1 hypothetical protein [Granulosicoccus sp.]
MQLVNINTTLPCLRLAIFGNATLIDQNKFKNNSVYNYAAAGMRPEEFPAYLRFFKEENVNDIDVLFFGADFREYFENDYGHMPPEHFISKVSMPGYRVKEILSMSEVGMTLRSLEMKRTGYGIKHYEVGNVANHIRLPELVVEDRISQGLEADSYENLVADSEYESYIDATIEAAGETQIIAFTTPISHFRTKLFFDQGKEVEYKDWLKLLIRKFGKVYHFSDLNAITRNHKKYYYDSYHTYPEVGYMIVDFIESEGEMKYENFGIILTSENIDDYLQNISKK